MSVSENIYRINSELPTGTRLVAVSKFQPVEAILEAYQAGQRIFGENRVQELCEKQPLCPNDIEWHFIGHLQTNKIKQIVPFVSLIHGVDSLKLLKEINKEAEKASRIIPCLLQMHIAQEESKFGFSFDECRDILSNGYLKDLRFIRICGLMGMATLTENTAQIRSEFKCLRISFEYFKKNFFMDESAFCELSMGMSDDYQIAIEEGSTMIRIGSAIFGARVYSCNGKLDL
ncbi:MAG: YggS family pyridoxal phosphate-dependent enzyme [Bacteroidales bacterium]|nr:YggS family pyridoxal phosphate-dependent enzyme [Bacteroidales bacterium]